MDIFAEQETILDDTILAATEITVDEIVRSDCIHISPNEKIHDIYAKEQAPNLLANKHNSTIRHQCYMSSLDPRLLVRHQHLVFLA